MCLSSVSWLYSAYHYFYPVKQMDGYKILHKQWNTNALRSPLYSQCGEWKVGERKQADDHGFYFFPSRKEAMKYNSYQDLYPVRAYGVFRKGKQDGAIVYMAKEMELLSSPVTPTQEEKDKTVNEILEHLAAL